MKFDYKRLQYLYTQSKEGIAEDWEEDELVKMVYLSGALTEKSYNDYYRCNENKKEIFQTALILASIKLVQNLLEEFIKAMKDK